MPPAVSVIGLAGPSASGKSTVAARLCSWLGDAALLSLDSYYDTDESTLETANFCDLSYLKVDTFVEHVAALARGEPALQAELDSATFAPTGRTVRIAPGRFLVLEGMVLFRIPEIVELCDVRLYLAPSIEEIRERKLRRDAKERGRSRESTEAQLRWVADEYRADLVDLDGRITVIQGDGSPSDVFQAVRAHVGRRKRPA